MAKTKITKSTNSSKNDKNGKTMAIKPAKPTKAQAVRHRDICSVAFALRSCFGPRGIAGRALPLLQQSVIYKPNACKHLLCKDCALIFTKCPVTKCSKEFLYCEPVKPVLEIEIDDDTDDDTDDANVQPVLEIKIDDGADDDTDDEEDYENDPGWIQAVKFQTGRIN